ncbi:MAG: biotin-dependent carboxyltransferase family protein [Candidatus Thermoplasmatota archaeon]|nr:biotin-dependent carboxyltransferase family protein [Candidatus Thermoplasmatota archaeon]
MLEIAQHGLEAAVQDVYGRPGYYSYGIPPSGAQDGLSLGLGNLLVGNDKNEAGLEITLLGPQIRFTEDHVVALTGADLSAKVNDAVAPRWEAFGVKRGDLLTFGRIQSGCRVYLAVAGGIDVPEVLGSKATYARGEIGGHEGRVLQKGDALRIGTSGAETGDLIGRRLKSALVPAFTNAWELRVVIGLEDYVYTKKGIQTFLEADWIVSSKIDRVGYRYQGPELECVEREPPHGAGSDPTNVVDSGYPVGSIHTTGTGVEPILLPNDAVSGGGYATIGTVISADLDRVGQSKTGDHTRFKGVDVEEGYRAWAEREKLMTEASLA